MERTRNNPAARRWCLMACGFLLFTAHAAIAKEPLGSTWPASQQVSMDQINHSAFDALLKKYVDADGYVHYAAWQASSTDRQTLQQYLVQLSQANPTAQASREG